MGKIYLSKDVGNATLSIYNTEDNKFIGYFHKDMFEDWITLNRENILSDLLVIKIKLVSLYSDRVIRNGKMECHPN